MREFILLARKAFTGWFSLNDLPGAGRMDLVARCISSAIFISYAIRKNVRFYACLEGPPSPPRLIIFEPWKLKAVSPDERNIASHIRIALKKFKGKPIESEPGIWVLKKSFEELVKEKVKEKKVFYLHEKGEDIESLKLEENSCFILGDHKGLDKKREIFLDKLGIERISLGKVSYLASTCISIIHWILDRELNSKVKNSDFNK